MAKRMKVCKICGKEYNCCADPFEGYKWSDVACCKEHGAEYLKLVLAARNPEPVADQEPKATSQTRRLQAKAKAEEVETEE